MPAQSRRQEASEQYQTEDFQIRLETVDGFQAAEDAWLACAREAFPGRSGAVADFVSTIQRAIGDQVARFVEADRSLEQLAAVLNNAQRLGDPAAAEADASARAGERRLALENIKRHRVAFDRQQAQESSLLALFSFIPAIERKRVLRASIALDGLAGLEGLKRVSEIDHHVAQMLHKAETEHAAAEDVLCGIRKLLAEIATAQSVRKQALIAIDGKDGLEDGLEDRLDLNQRFELFRLATHYWEGRWLLAMEADLAGIVASCQYRSNTPQK